MRLITMHALRYEDLPGERCVVDELDIVECEEAKGRACERSGSMLEVLTSSMMTSRRESRMHLLIASQSSDTTACKLTGGFVLEIKFNT